MNFHSFPSFILALSGSVLLGGGSLAQPLRQPPATSNANKSAWNEVVKALSGHSTTAAPALARQEGPPTREGEWVLFRFHAPSDAVKVYLAGSFNDFAANHNGAISSDLFAMQTAGNGFFYKRVSLVPGTYAYKYVELDKNGQFHWVSDSQVQETDKDGNTILNVAAMPNVTSGTAQGATNRALKPFAPLIAAQFAALRALDVRAQKVCGQPDEPQILLATLGDEASGARLKVDVLTPFGTRVYQTSVAAQKGDNRVTIPPLKSEGGFLVRVTLMRGDRTLGAGETVLSVVRNIAADLRYGFYATYKDPKQTGADYGAKAAMLAKYHINGVEFYDYFPGHGYYAPREENYKFEPFGIPLNARDVQQKIDAGHKRNILSLAYVASYAASESIYRKYPFPMRDEKGVPKIFNGSIMTEAEADRQNKAKWFWLMDVSSGSPWHKYILEEFGRTLDDSRSDLVSFDGFELDTYGDASDTRFYAKDSKRSGDLLTDVLHDFVGDVQKETHLLKPNGLVSFNSVNEFGVEKMSDVTDFGFLEIWNFYTQNLENLVDICFRRRAPLPSKRVVLKLYPADMTPRQTNWPAATLRRLLGATMTGAGSLMVAGEPDEKSGQMHGLNSLYYPDHQPLSPESENVLRDYYSFDALMYGITHGRGVQNTALENPISGCITRTYTVSAKKALVVQMLNVEGERKWTLDTPAQAPRKNVAVELDLPDGIAPNSVIFASPDATSLQKPVKLDFEVRGGKLRIQLPELNVYGVLVLRY